MKLRLLTIVLFLLPNLALAEARQIDKYQWEGVERIVAVGDIHGDYDNYMATLKAAGLVDKKGKWAGGTTHFVQVGDLPDRGPDTLKIIEHIKALGKQAKKKGGRVHNLIGNHEVMNVTGDLRYVHPGEYEAFAGRKSKSLRDRYYELYLERLEEVDPETFANLPEDHQEKWDADHPLGWLEHRQAWDPAWSRDAEIAKWVMDNPVAVRVNDNVFVHGGISAYYCANTLASLTEKAVAKMKDYNPEDPGILEDPNGPFWYRGLSGIEPKALPETVDAILAAQGVNHVVVGHSPKRGVIWPEYGGKVLVIDTGISGHYGGFVAYLDISPEGRFAGYPGGKLALPASEDDVIPYLEQVIELDPGNKYLKQRLLKLRQPPAEPAESSNSGETVAEGEEAPADIPICGTS